jgi:mono/diheme cytochrome c family protein
MSNLMSYKNAVAGSSLILLLWTASPDSQAQETEVIAGGEIDYQMHCAVCHNRDGKGDGIMVKYLNLRPSDLTQLSKKSHGEFPFWRVYRTIDGREEVGGHGNRAMPIWGSRFQAEAEGGGVAARATAAGRILGLVFYIRSIQER